MKRFPPALVLAASAAAVGCSAFRQKVPPQEPGIVFYSDLGPNEIDVSGYPAERKRQYAVYARVCSQCHSLARSVNAPVVSRDFWEMYVMAMRRRTYYHPVPETSANDANAIVDFLDFDSRERKLGARQNEFEERSRELKKKFSAMMDARAR